MRQHINTNNFLKGGRPFYYRDIFSGLNNEKMGPALYQFTSLPACHLIVAAALSPKLFSLYNHSHCPVKVCIHSYLSIPARAENVKYKMMKSIKPNIWETVHYYLPLLKRYARCLTNDESASELLARKVLEDQYQIDGLAPSKKLRKVLKTDLLNRCIFWKQFIILDRPPVKTTSHKRVNPQLN